MDKRSTHDQKRQAIFRAAMDLFSTRGFEGTTLEAVADALGYTKPALYYYFHNKEDLFQSMAKDAQEVASARIDAIAGGPGSSYEKISAILKMHIDDYFLEGGYLSKSISIMASYGEGICDRRVATFLSDPIIRLFRDAIDEGKLRREDPAVLGITAFAMLAGVFLHHRAPILEQVDRDTYAASLHDIILKGISA